MAGIAPNPAALYVHLFGSALFCAVFLYLRRESGVVYFGYWGLAWGLETAAMICALRHFLGGAWFWLYPWSFFEFSFAVALLAAAQAEVHPEAKLKARVLLGYPLFLLLVYGLGAGSSFAAYHALHSLMLAAFYLYTYFAAPVMDGLGRRLFRVALLFLAIASLHHAVVFSYARLAGAAPRWAPYAPYHDLFDFGLQTVLAFAAMATWIGRLNERLRSLGDQLTRVQKETSRSIEVDRLTGLLNHAALSRRMESARGFVGTVAVCDLDNFKEVNDRYGHLVGDEVLRNIGNLIRASIRKEDEPFRWGGDEFVIIFYDENLPVVRNRMQQLEARLRNFQVRGHGSLPIELSWGAAEAAWRPLREVLDAADREMYSVKRMRH
jgi:diguanylate cyclase (GGDEF)-like protein